MVLKEKTMLPFHMLVPPSYEATSFNVCSKGDVKNSELYGNRGNFGEKSKVGYCF